MCFAVLGNGGHGRHCSTRRDKSQVGRSCSRNRPTCTHTRYLRRRKVWPAIHVWSRLELGCALEKVFERHFLILFIAVILVDRKRPVGYGRQS
ncbi:hypothetical protein BCR44DRAFT_1432714 [Catenaria anguillulae PL171]|uniref:Uncharacterized protein n=1 Tax=Catenaria anguillulae PL171 TaxID=765915 RepID=A0A1Y2HPD2_9FUNG|nr:hypothetical protein BCR44DRAFT_1432714 [Catenaria anguillulae PL171]